MNSDYWLNSIFKNLCIKAKDFINLSYLETFNLYCDCRLHVVIQRLIGI